MDKPLIYRLITAFICILITSGAAAQDKKLYSWTDENGTVHFSDTQPEGLDVEEAVAVALELLQVPNLGGGVAGDVNDAPGCKGEELL